MSALQLLSGPQGQRLGLTLLHFIWQGIAVAAIAAATVFLVRLRPGRQRYAAYLLALAAMLACPIITYVKMAPPPLIAAIHEDSAMNTPISRTFAPVAESGAPQISGAAVSWAIAPAARLNWRDAAKQWLMAGLPWALAAWAVGVGALGIRLLMGLAGIHRWKNGAHPLPPELLDRAQKLGGRMGLKNFRRLFSSPRMAQPAAVGFLRPVVILPASLLTGMPPDVLDAVIAHELAHIRRLDPWVNLVQRFIETLLFYHPAVWWLSRQVRMEREICCDEIAVAATERMTYVCALEQVARFTLGLPQPDYFNGLAVAFGGQRPDLLHRIKHLLEMPTPRSRNNWPAGALAIAVLVVSVGVSRSAGQKGQSSTTGAPADAPAPSAPSDHASDGATISNPTSREGHDATAKENALLTPVEEAAKEARAQAVRNEERAELDVKEAELTLDAKRMDFARLEAARVRHGVAQTEVDNAKLAVSLGDIQLQRAKLALADAHAKTQSLVTSEVKITLRSDLGNRDGWFSIKGRDVTLRQLLNQEEKKIAAFEKKGEGQVTLYRVIDGSLHKFLDGAPLADVMSGKGKNPALKPGDEVTVKFDSRVAKNVTFRVFVPGQRQPPGGSWQELPERNMTLTQVLAASNYDVKALANQPVTLIRKGKDGNDEKVLDNVPLGRLIDGKVKDEIIVSGDTIQVGDNSPAARETPEGANKRVGK